MELNDLFGETTPSTVKLSGGKSFQFRFYGQRITAEVAAQIVERLKQGTADDIADVLAEYVAEWPLTHKGKPVPIEAKAIKKQVPLLVIGAVAANIVRLDADPTNETG